MIATTQDAFQLLMDGASALARMESSGIRIDVPYLEQAITDTGKEIKDLEEKLYVSETWDLWKSENGSKAKLGSKQQLADLLFGKLKHPHPGKKTKTGRYRSDEETLGSVDLEFVQEYIYLEKLKKVSNTYLLNIRNETVDGVLHPFSNLHLAETFRSSMDSPSFQNMPIRDPRFGKLIRTAFIPRKGRVLVEVDYGALEFKIAACVWKDPKMIEYASDPSKDIHRDMAAKCYRLKKEEVSRDSRYIGKNGFVFPRLYGSDYINISRNMWAGIDEKKLTTVSGIPMREHLKAKGITRLGVCERNRKPEQGTFEAHIQGVQDWFEEAFPDLHAAKKRWIDSYRKTGEFRMVTGFVCRGLFSNNFLLNAPIQGPGFHCLLWSLIRLQTWLQKHKLKTKIVGQIHDCLLMDCPISEVQDVLNAAEWIMTTSLRKAWSWVVTPMSVEVDVTPEGGNWHQKQPFVKKDGQWTVK